MLPQIR